MKCPRRRLGWRVDDFAALHGLETRRPSVLVECAFISNPEEARLLGDDLGGFKERLAVAIFEGLSASLLGEREPQPA